MTTEQFIEVLKSPTRRALNVSMRQATMYLLYKNGVPVAAIARSMKITRGTVYNGIYKHTNLMDCYDKLALEANDEVANHKIVIKPTLFSSDVCVMPVGQVLVIDNIIY